MYSYDNYPISEFQDKVKNFTGYLLPGFNVSFHALYFIIMQLSGAIQTLTRAEEGRGEA